MKTQETRHGTALSLSGGPSQRLKAKGVARRAARRLLPLVLNFALATFLGPWIGTAPAAHAQVRGDLRALGGIESLKLTNVIQGYTLPSLSGGQWGLGLSGDLGRWKRFAVGADLDYFQFNSNAKLEQEQFGNVEKGDFSASASGISATLKVNYYVTESLRLSLGYAYDHGFSGDVKFNIGVLSFNPEVKGFDRSGAMIGADWMVWRGLTFGAQAAIKWGTIDLKAAENDLIVIDGTQPFRSLSVQATAGWALLTSSSVSTGPERSGRGLSPGPQKGASPGGNPRGKGLPPKRRSMPGAPPAR